MWPFFRIGVTVTDVSIFSSKGHRSRSPDVKNLRNMTHTWRTWSLTGGGSRATRLARCRSRLSYSIGWLYSLSGLSASSWSIVHSYLFFFFLSFVSLEIQQNCQANIGLHVSYVDHAGRRLDSNMSSTDTLSRTALYCVLISRLLR